jgi:hypothetical protein
VPALLASHPRRVSREAASVVSIPTGIDLLLRILLAAFFPPPKPTPKASSIRASGPAHNRVASGHSISPPRRLLLHARFFDVLSFPGRRRNVSYGDVGHSLIGVRSSEK